MSRSQPMESGKILDKLCREAESLCEINRTAERNSKSLHGQGFYADKFHAVLARLTLLESEVVDLLKSTEIGPDTIASVAKCLSVVKSTDAKARTRCTALRDLRLTFSATVAPHFDLRAADSIPRSEQVLPMAVVDKTRGYIVKVVQQANGCYEHQWFDACAVMIRKLVEILIIEVFEAHAKSADIKDKDHNYFMLGDLVDRLLAEPKWTLGRETKRFLPEIKTSGNRSAHNRFYIATKGDLDRLLPGLRVAVDEMLHLSKIK